MENFMKINDAKVQELLTDDGHMGTFQLTPKCLSYDRKTGTIEALKHLHTKNLIHVGCCGHFHNIQKQIENQSHFHAILTNTFEKVIGFDINTKAVDYLSSFGITHIYAMDIVEEQSSVLNIIHEVFGDEPYTLLLPEVLEHIPNPVDFLSAIVQYYGEQNNNIVISVPNAYGFGRICDALFHNRESINMDHKYMFTPTTLLKVMCIAGIIPDELQFLDLYKYSHIFKKPMLGNTILCTGHFQ